jgi:hypothetical protein
MLFVKPAPVVCTVCGQAIAPHERRFVEKNRITKIEQHTHVNCSPVKRTTTDHRNPRIGT